MELYCFTEIYARLVIIPMQPCCPQFVQLWMQVGLISSNAVEAYNHLCMEGRKRPKPTVSCDIMSLYKKDMVAVLQDLAEKAGKPTIHEDRSVTARQSLCKKKCQCKAGDNAQGLPDHKSDFTRKRKGQMLIRRFAELTYGACVEFVTIRYGSIVPTV